MSSFAQARSSTLGGRSRFSLLSAICCAPCWPVSAFDPVETEPRGNGFGSRGIVTVLSFCVRAVDTFIGVGRSCRLTGLFSQPNSEVCGISYHLCVCIAIDVRNARIASGDSVDKARRCFGDGAVRAPHQNFHLRHWPQLEPEDSSYECCDGQRRLQTGATCFQCVCLLLWKPLVCED